MAWSWSHTNEAYRDARANLDDLPRDTVAVIWAEWRAWDGNTFHAGFDSKTYKRELRRAYSRMYRDKQRGLEVYGENGTLKLASMESMLSDIWERASSEDTGRTCDNGGFNAWLCPFGCGCHTVPFDREQ